MKKWEPSKSALRIEQAERSGKHFDKMDMFSDLNKKIAEDVGKNFDNIEHNAFKLSETFIADFLESSLSINLPIE